MRVTLIHNPTAGGEDRPCADELISLIRGEGHAVIYQSSAAAGWDRVLQEHSDIVAVAGGDGIVGQVAKRVVGRYLPIAVLPLGTANNIASALGLLNQSPSQLIAGWNTARRQPFDTGIAVGPWGTKRFVEGLGVGIFADTMARFDARKNVDIAHLSRAEAKLLAVTEVMRARLEGSSVHTLDLVLDGEDISGDYILIEVMNIRSIGPNLDLAPAADPGDGLFDIVLIKKTELEQLREYLTARIHRRSELPSLLCRRGRKLRIGCPELRIHIDDDLWPKTRFQPTSTTMDVDIDAASVEVLAPA